MGTAIKTTHCEICGELTHMLGTKLCDNCWELQNRLLYAMGIEKFREWIVKRVMTADMANAIIDMDNLGWSEGIHPSRPGRPEAWEALVNAAEKVTVRYSHRTEWKRSQKKLLDKADSI